MKRTYTEIKYIVIAKGNESVRKRYRSIVDRDIFMAGVRYASKQFVDYLVKNCDE